MTITDPALREYAELLHANGFNIYESTRSAKYFVYSRMVDGVECFGDVQRDDVGFGYSHYMPIKPSVENGSSMFVDYPDGRPVNDLTIEAAKQVAKPTNWNRLVGLQKNDSDAVRYDHYTKWS